MEKLIKTLGLGNIINILCMVFAAGLAYGKINSTIDEFKMLRSNDLIRIERMENSHEVLKERVTVIEKANVGIQVDLQYIKAGIEEIKRSLNNKPAAASK